MNKKMILILAMVLFLSNTVLVFSQAVPKAPAAVARTLKGMNISIGTHWSDYDTEKKPPMLSWNGGDYQERELDYRKRLLAEYGFKMQEKTIASYNEMPQITATSIMAGRPAATVFLLEPNWAVALHRQNLIYPVGTRKIINLNAVTPVEWNRSVNEAFTFNNKIYAFKEDYGRSEHTTCVFWNKRLFKEAGLDPNLPYDLQKDGTWTWDKFLEISKKLTRDINNDGVVDTYAMTGDLSTYILDAFVSSNGAMYVDRDKNGKLVNASKRPEFVEAVRFYMRLRDEGVMKAKPAGDKTPWNWYIPEFNDGRVAMRIDQQSLATNDLRSMKDDWGMVLPPKGPKAKNYVVFNDENVYVLPARGFTEAQIDAILWAVQAWVTPIDTNWKLKEYANYRDRRAVDETMALIRDKKLQQWKYHLHVPGLNRGGIAWEIWYHEGEAAQLIEAVSQSWNNLIEDANEL